MFGCYDGGFVKNVDLRERCYSWDVPEENKDVIHVDRSLASEIRSTKLFKNRK